MIYVASTLKVKYIFGLWCLTHVSVHHHDTNIYDYI